MAKARLSVNDQEAALVASARALSKLQAKRRQKADELAALDTDIEVKRDELRTLTGPELTGE